MNVLVIGSGGREHAIVSKLNESTLLDKLYVAPGNYGISQEATIVDINVDDKINLINFVQSKAIDLVVIGPEAALISGLADELIKRDILVLGPTKNAARIESSKEYAKELMNKYNIPNASYQSFINYDHAKKYLEDKNEYPIVIKYDGLAAGKGVFIVEDEDGALETIDMLLNKKELGDDGIIIEEFLVGDEFTLLSLVKGNKVYPFQVARDFKRVFDNDEGLNTGGMGAICPYNKVSDQEYKEAVKILEKTASALVNEGNSFTGVLYGGFIKTKNGIKVIEFNARFGDPETQCVLNNLKSDLLKNILDLLNDKEVELAFKNQVSVGLVLSAPGYPETYKTNIDLNDYLTLPYKIYHMATKQDNEIVVSSGGRVLFVLNEGDTSAQAYQTLYKGLNKLSTNKLHYRLDLDKY